MGKATDQRDVQTISLLWTSLLLLYGGAVTWFGVMKLLAGWDEVMWFVVRWRPTKYYSSTALYYKVLVQYSSVLQGISPVLLCTRKYNKVLLQCYKVPVLLQYYSTTTLYYNVLLQYYSVLQYYSAYYKVLLQNYAVLQSTSPVLL